MRVYFFKWLVPLFCALCVTSAQAEDLTFKGDYVFSWSGLRLGKLHLEMQQDDAQYNVESKLKTAGIVAFFSNHKSTTKVSGKKLTSNSLRPTAYRSDYRSGGKDKSIEMKYDAQGNVIKEEVLPWRGARPEVTDELKSGVGDSLTAILSMRSAIKDALAKNQTNIQVPVFDGVRRFDLHARILDKNSSIKLDDKSIPVVKLSLKRVPLGGFKEKELKKMAKGEPELQFFIEKEHFTLLGLQVELYGGTVTAWRKKACVNEECSPNQMASK